MQYIDQIDDFLAALDEYEKSIDFGHTDLPVLYTTSLPRQYLKSYLLTDNGLCFCFADGSKLSLHDYHSQYCCENVYADWGSLKHMLVQDFAVAVWSKLEILGVEGAGFVVKLTNEASALKQTYFVPCYNEQNGYYSSNLELIIDKDGDDAVTVCISNCVLDRIE